MPLDTEHNEVLAHKDQWRRADDAFAGQDRIKASGETYLPKLSGQTDERYTSYLMQTLFYNASKRTVNALQGLLYRKPPKLELPGKLNEFTDDITASDMTLISFVKWVSKEVLKRGRCGILASLNDTEERPILAGYLATQITNWRLGRIDGHSMLTHLRLLEPQEITDPEDRWRTITRPRYRVLDLVPGEEGGLSLQVGLYVRNPDESASPEDQWILDPEEDINPWIATRGGTDVPFIPFTFVNPSGISPDVEEPPFLDLVDINLDHYRLDAFHKHALKMCGLPQHWFAGFEFEETESEDARDEGTSLDRKVAIGADYALVAKDPAAKAGMLEFTGAGVTPISTEKEKDEERMAALGARAIETRKSGVETAEAMQLRHQGEQSTLSEVAGSVEDALRNSIGHFAWWAGVSADGEFPSGAAVELNRDYYAPSITPQMLGALVQARQAGEIDQETFFYNLERGEMIEEGTSVEDMQTRIEAQVPALMILDTEVA